MKLNVTAACSLSVKENVVPTGGRLLALKWGRVLLSRHLCAASATAPKTGATGASAGGAGAGAGGAGAGAGATTV
jgi:hypothetical protein